MYENEKQKVIFMTMYLYQGRQLNACSAQKLGCKHVQDKEQGISMIETHSETSRA